MLDFGYYNMDCMEGMKEFPDKYFELCIVDPPYGLGDKLLKGGKNGNVVQMGKMYERSEWEDIKPTKEYFTELFRVSQNQIICGANYFSDMIPPSRGIVCWDKLKGDNHNFSHFELIWTSFDCIARIFKKVSNLDDRFHPCQKPVALYEWLLRNYAKQGDKILDTHVGSASSLNACHNLGFQYVGFELDKEYYEKSLDRLETAKKQVSILDVIEKKENTQIGMEV